MNLGKRLLTRKNAEDEPEIEDAGKVALVEDPSLQPDRPRSTKDAMSTELRHIESLARKTLGAIVVALFMYAAAVSFHADKSPAREERPVGTADVHISSRTSLTLTVSTEPEGSQADTSPSVSPTPPVAPTPLAPPACVRDAANACAADGRKPPGLSRSFSHRDFLFTFSLYGTLLVSTVVVGGFLGFLFGIPRQIQKALVEGMDIKAAKFVGNTNLEEISDWLTKIIVGLGLTQAGKLYDGFIITKDEFVNVSMANAAGADGMFTTVVLSGVILGFLTIYMETRTRVTLLLVTSDHVQSGYAAEQLLAETVQSFDEEKALQALGITETGAEIFQTPPSEKDRKIATLPVEGDRGIKELVALAFSQIRMRNFSQAEKALVKAIGKTPNRLDLQTALAAVKNRAGQPMAANEILERAAESHPENASLWREKLLASLYLKPPQSYISALEAARQLLLRDERAKNDAFVQLWIACANGQKFKYLSDLHSQMPGDEKDELKQARESALTAINAVIANSEPGTVVRKSLREVFDPATHKSVSPTDNDLEVFKADQEFVNLINTAT